VSTLLLARHAEAASNVDGVVNGRPPGEGLSDAGKREAEALGRALSGRRIELGVATRFRRTRETLRLALAGGRAGVPTIVVPELDEIDFGSFEGGPLGAYREWAWTHEPDARCPGDGETRVEVAMRIAIALDLLLARAEETILVVGHSLPIRYVLDAADGRFPAAKIEQVAHATPYPLGRARAERAAETLRAWADEPQFRDTSEA
jgi:broad specificity phosphatase PhoE